MGPTGENKGKKKLKKDPKVDKINAQSNNVDNDIDENNGNENEIEDSSEKNNINLVHKCTFAGCEKSFDRLSRLTWHLHQHTGERPYKCNAENCDKSYATPSHLKRHLKSHVPVDVDDTVILYRCGTCQLTLKSQFNLARHYERAHEKKVHLYCEECNILYRRKITYDEHLAIHHNGELFKCDQCGHEFKRVNNLRKHIKSHSTTYTCPVDNCNVICDTYIQLRKHSTTHAKEYICHKCNKVLNTFNKLNRHLKTHEDKLLVCPYIECHKKYHHNNQLKIHIRKKHESPKYECDLCKKFFAYKSVLSKHIELMHSTERSKCFKKGDKVKIKLRSGKQTSSKSSVSTKVSSSQKTEEKETSCDNSIIFPDTNFEFVKVEPL